MNWPQIGCGVKKNGFTDEMSLKELKSKFNKTALKRFARGKKKVSAAKLFRGQTLKAGGKYAKVCINRKATIRQ